MAYLPKSKLMIAGSGEELASLQRLVESLGIQEYVSFLGYRKDIDNLITESDVLILSSVTEGLPITILEAMYLKTIIAYTDVGSVDIVLENGYGGVRIDHGKDEEAASKIVNLLKNEDEINRKINFCFQRVSKYYTSAIMARNYQSCYSSALNGDVL